MPRTELSLGLDGNTFKILYVFYYHSSKNEAKGMRYFYLGHPIEGLGFNAIIKAFNYLRRNNLILKVEPNHCCHEYLITSKGIELLHDTLLKRQQKGLSYRCEGICLEADPNTKQISLKKIKCCHRIEISCIPMSEIIDFCTCEIPPEQEKELLAFLRKNNNQCSCETLIRHCPLANSCKRRIGSNRCTEKLSFVFSPPDEVDQKLHD
jgi:hypothetical protein